MKFPYLKFFSLLILPLIVIILTSVYFQSKKNQIIILEEAGIKVASIPYQSILYEGFGSIYTPNVTFAVKTASGFKDYNFLVDTGAIVSALPAKESIDLGINLAFLPRIAVEGYGGQTTFTYRGEIKIRLLEDLISLPCVFSEVDKSNYILGRKGIFENYTITFDSQKRAIEFIKKM